MKKFIIASVFCFFATSASFAVESTEKSGVRCDCCVVKTQPCRQIASAVKNASLTVVGAAKNAAEAAVCETKQAVKNVVCAAEARKEARRKARKESKKCCCDCNC